MSIRSRSGGRDGTPRSADLVLLRDLVPDRPDLRMSRFQLIDPDFV